MNRLMFFHREVLLAKKYLHSMNFTRASSCTVWYVWFLSFFFVNRSLLRIPDCIDVLKELNAAALDSCDSHGRALYMCCCFDLILEGGEAKTNKQTNTQIKQQHPLQKKWCSPVRKTSCEYLKTQHYSRIFWHFPKRKSNVLPLFSSRQIGVFVPLSSSFPPQWTLWKRLFS